MKYKFCNLVMVTLGASYLVIPAPLATAKPAADAPAKHKRKEGAAPTAASCRNRRRFMRCTITAARAGIKAGAMRTVGGGPAFANCRR